MNPQLSTPLFRSDAELVTLLAAGRQEALSVLYDRYAGLLVAVGLRVLGDRRDAEDVVHDVFVEAWRSAGQYDASRGTVRAWLIMRMRSRALDRRKSPSVSRSVSLDAQRHEWLASDDDPTAQPDRLRVRRALTGLTDEQREIIELAYFEGLSSSEMAARLGLPLGTVKSRAAASLTRLRAELGADKGAA